MTCIEEPEVALVRRRVSKPVARRFETVRVMNQYPSRSLNVEDDASSAPVKLERQNLRWDCRS
jgi:hypothetical protein